MDVTRAVVLFLHVLGGSAWLGGSVFANAVLLPYLVGRPVDQRRAIVRRLIIGPERLMIGAALLAATSGLAQGIAFGRIRSVEALGTTYGQVWLASIAAAVVVFGVGGRITSPAARRLVDDDELWSTGSGGAPTPLLESTLGRLRVGFAIELMGIVVILALMMVLRFV